MSRKNLRLNGYLTFSSLLSSSLDCTLHCLLICSLYFTNNSYSPLTYDLIELWVVLGADLSLF